MKLSKEGLAQLENAWESDYAVNTFITVYAFLKSISPRRSYRGLSKQWEKDISWLKILEWQQMKLKDFWQQREHVLENHHRCYGPIWWAFEKEEVKGERGDGKDNTSTFYHELLILILYCFI